ncbi:hypothetical protein NE237_007899 [Protea cynaroides]|uniref:Uncharacterized protein n=1 Tax=Protea cynaroides TaxID=273540 RepID=A0A9Q0QWK0_9MAGN|nr:hypothetical protein NE237_007899 [Protea cynaroides]
MDRDKMGRKRVYGVTLILMVILVEAVLEVTTHYRQPLCPEYANKKTEDCLHRCSVRHARVWYLSRRNPFPSSLLQHSRAAYPALPTKRDPSALCVRRPTHVWRIILMVGAIPCSTYLPLAYEDARDRSLHGPRGPKCETGRIDMAHGVECGDGSGTGR